MASISLRPHPCPCARARISICKCAGYFLQDEYKKIASEEKREGMAREPGETSKRERGERKGEK